MTVAKYWGDERHPDAVYAVYLRKVRYASPPEASEPQYRPLDSDRLQWETVKERLIKAGTLKRLTECLLNSDGKLDSRHFNVFFATFRAFGRAEEVVGVLIEWFERTENEAIRNGIRSVIICWMDMYSEDFYDSTDPHFPLLSLITDFSRRNSLLDLKHKSRRLREKFGRIAESGGLSSQLPSIGQYIYALDYDPNEPKYAKERAQMFDVSKENCVQIAEQLTFWDAVLFRELRPYQCQGAIWSRRHKTHIDNVYSVKATIDQFNAVSQRVMTSVVLPDCRPEFRSRIVEKWIEVAKELRTLRNYSSLKAILSSLQSEPVFRLQKSAWGNISKSSLLLFRELSSMFETTEDTELSKRPFCRRTKSDVNLCEPQGSVPFLGSFLTDFVMIDQAHSDTTDDGFVNFEKRRREFEIMAKIRLFQSAAQSYSVPMDQAFCAWFFYLPVLSENECFQRSLEVEPTIPSTPDGIRRGRPAASSGGKGNSIAKMFGYLADEFSFRGSPLLNGQTEGEEWANNDSTIAMALISRGKMLASSGMGALSPQFRSPNEFHAQNFRSDDSLPRNRHSEGSSRAATPLNGDGTPSRQSSFQIGRRMPQQQSSSSHTSNSSNGSFLSATTTSPSTFSNGIPTPTIPNFHLARVGLDDQMQTEGTNYKCIKIENGDRMGTLIDRALEKHMMEEENREDFCLVQLLADGGEFRLPDHCAPFYAVSPDPSSPMLNLVLRRREAVEKQVAAPSAKKLNRQKRSNLLRWSSGYL